MAIVACPTCAARLELDDQYLGQEVDCGACGAVFVARAEGTPDPPADASLRSDRPTDDAEDRPRRYDDDEDEDRPRRRRSRSPERVREDAAVRVAGPGLALQIVAGCLGVATVAVATAQMAIMAFMPAPPNPQPNDNMMRLVFGAVYAASGLFGGMYFAVLVYAANKLRKMESRGWSLAAIIMSFLSVIPMCGGCGGGGLCGLLFVLPFGIWALVAFLNRDVQETFAATAPDDEG